MVFEYGVSGTGFLIDGFAIRGFGYGVTGSGFHDSGFLQVRAFRLGFRGSVFSIFGVLCRGFSKLGVSCTGFA